MTSPILRSLAVLAAVAGLSACATPVPEANDDARLSTERFTAKVTSEPEELRLALHAQGISEGQAAALVTFSETWRENEARTIKIQAPSGARDPAAAYRMSESARTFLIAQGVPEARIELAGYDPGDDKAAPLIVGYLRYRAEIPKCGQTWTNIAHSNSNSVQPNFGCAVTANMAAQIADPADLLGPREMTPQDAARRQGVLDKYRTGTKTAGERDKDADGAVSRAVE